MKTMDEIKLLREKLAERRLELVFRLTAHDDVKLSTIAHIQTSIEAIDTVISDGKIPPEKVTSPGILSRTRKP